AIIGIALIFRFSKISSMRLLCIGYTIMVIGAGILVGAPVLVVLVAGVVIVSIGNSPMAVGHNAPQQRLVPEGILGRVRSVDEVVSAIGYIVGVGLAGFLGDLLGPRALLGISFCAILLAAVTVLTGLRVSVNRSQPVDEATIQEDTAG